MSAPRHPLRVLQSRRMTLVAATEELIAADLAGRQQLGAALGADVSEEWPPEYYGSTTMRAAKAQLRDPSEHGWSIWYLLTSRHESPRLLGISDFKGKPDAAGRVEISYSILPHYRVQGYAAEAVARLVTWAFSHQNVVEVSAETMPHMRQSIRVLEKNGFSLTGRGSEQGVVRYVVHKATYS
jgi:ribosomal-protein-alanine N-acetyltransferase